MTNLTSKTLSRTIRQTFGRYTAILAIVALGVGFFTGLKNAQPAMQSTADAYLKEQNMYDFRILSYTGFTFGDILALSELDGIKAVEGGFFLDAAAEDADGGTFVYKLFSLPAKISLPKLTAGRMPRSANECAADASVFTSSDIGTKITLSAENDGAAALSQTEYTIVGLVQSPRFISSDRGSSAAGSGSISGFLYILPEVFRQEAYSELLLAADTDATIFSEEYETEIAALSHSIEAALSDPSCRLLTLDANSGYASFKNDTAIVDGIANAFPAFFVLIAALVCITTMTRMVDEERIQIGTLKAMGYSSSVISRKYILYASSAALIGCITGFFIGTGVIPQVIWNVYGVSYGFSKLVYYFSPAMYAYCLAVSVPGSVFVTLFACGRELRGKPSELVRPKPPQSGGRILLERADFLWKNMSFLWKSTFRNAFRYKKRMAMMLIGISGCTALIVTGFGIKDSVANILDYQYGEIMLYDAAASFEGGSQNKSVLDAFLSDLQLPHEFAYQERLFVSASKAGKEATVIAVPPETANAYFDLHTPDKRLSYPTGKNAILSKKLASQLGVTVGGTISLTLDGVLTDYTVAGICENFLGHYVYISYDPVTGCEPNTVFLRAQNGEDISETAAKLRGMDGVGYVTVTAKERSDMEKTMSSINYIVLLVTVCAGVLAFIVLYNLTNINIMERIREVATVKVLGFHSGETGSYVLNENLLLSVFGALLGLALGKLLHWYVIKQVQVDSMAFDVRIFAQSYLISFACTVLFALISNFIMRFKLEKINMAESLKAVE